MSAAVAKNLTESLAILAEMHQDLEQLQAGLRDAYRRHAATLRLLGDACWLRVNFDTATAADRRKAASEVRVLSNYAEAIAQEIEAFLEIIPQAQAEQTLAYARHAQLLAPSTSEVP